jgi:transposase
MAAIRLPRGGGKQVETLVERCASLEVHKDSVTACVRVPDSHAGRQVETRRFTTTTVGLGLLAEWLASFAVTRVGMESTGCYWRPVWQLLEGQVECWLLNAAHLHHVPGRKTDVADAAWIAQLDGARAGPPQLRGRPARSGSCASPARYRKTQIQERSREVQRPGQAPLGRRDPSCRVWPPTCWASPAGRCWKPWSPAPTTRRCWPH